MDLTVLVGPGVAVSGQGGSCGHQEQQETGKQTGKLPGSMGAEHGVLPLWFPSLGFQPGPVVPEPEAEGKDAKSTKSSRVFDLSVLRQKEGIGSDRANCLKSQAIATRPAPGQHSQASTRGRGFVDGVDAVDKGPGVDVVDAPR